MYNLLELAKEAPNITISISITDLMEFHEKAMESAREQAAKELQDSGIDMTLSPETVSRMLDVDKTTLYRWNREKYLISYKIGGKVRYKKSDVENLLKGEH